MTGNRIRSGARSGRSPHLREEVRPPWPRRSRRPRRPSRRPSTSGRGTGARRSSRRPSRRAAAPTTSTTTCTCRATTPTRSRSTGPCSTTSRCGTSRSSGSSRSRARTRRPSRTSLTCRDLTKCAVGQGKYVLITAEDGGIVNDPVLLRDRGRPLVAGARRLGRRAVGARRRDPQRAWTSRFASRRSTRSRSRAPSRRTSCARSSATPVLDIKYYWTLTTELDGIPVVISRTGWTGEVGYEVYLRDPSRGGELWDRVMEAGRPHDIRPIAPCEARRIEAGIFNYGSDMTIADTPFHVMGLERLVEPQEADYIGKAALEEIRARRRRPQARRHRGRWRGAAVRAVAQVPRVPRRGSRSAR